MFVSGPDYVFFVLSVTQQMKLQSQINIALKKVCAGSINAGMLSHNFSDKRHHKRHTSLLEEISL